MKLIVHRLKDGRYLAHLQNNYGFFWVLDTIDPSTLSRKINILRQYANHIDKRTASAPK